MFRKIAISALAALSFAAPASAAPIQIPLGLDGETGWMFTEQTTGADETYFVEVLRQDSEGDILVELTNVRDIRVGYAWVDCSSDIISIDGDDWKPVDHRKHEGWWSDIACGRPVR